MAAHGKGKRKVKAVSILEAIKGSGGVVLTIADALGVDWHTAKRAIEENAEAKAAYEAETNKMIDLAESVLLMNIQLAAKQQDRGSFADTSDAKWLLSKKGKARGYGDKLELEHSVQVTWKEFINGDGNTKPDSK